jgi:hypothetical protein
MSKNKYMLCYVLLVILAQAKITVIVMSLKSTKNNGRLNAGSMDA